MCVLRKCDLITPLKLGKSLNLKYNGWAAKHNDEALIMFIVSLEKTKF